MFQGKQKKQKSQILESVKTIKTVWQTEKLESGRKCNNEDV